ncbi:MAG: hypothetical protein IJX98_01250 [Clostridia bacterium]|nr:hypothetical protein [Clostridia bacterium]
MNCLYDMDYEGLKEVVERVLYIKNWFVRDDKLSNRTDSIVYSERFQILKERATEKGYRFNDIEIVTWIDTMNILYYVFEKIKDENLRDSIKILQEYCIPYSNKRADYLLVYDNKILILEFSFNKLGYDLQYETKLQQAIGYKELLSNILPKEVDIGTYTFIVEAEEDKDGCALYIDGTDYFPNHYKIGKLAKYIQKFFKKNEDFAIHALNRLSETDEEEEDDSDDEEA